MWLLLLPLGMLAASQFPIIGVFFVGLGLVCLAFVLLAALDGTLHGIGHEFRSMWQPLIVWLPPGMRAHPGRSLAVLGFLAFMALNVSLHWLLR